MIYDYSDQNDGIIFKLKILKCLVRVLLKLSRSSYK